MSPKERLSLLRLLISYVAKNVEYLQQTKLNSIVTHACGRLFVLIT